MKNGNKPAFVKAAKDWQEFDYKNAGLTKREYFAAMAMQGLMANRELQIAISQDFANMKKSGNYPNEIDSVDKAWVFESIKTADELLKQLGE